MGARIRSDRLVKVVAAGIDEATETHGWRWSSWRATRLAKVLEQRALSPGELLEVFTPALPRARERRTAAGSCTATSSQGTSSSRTPAG
ncbi:MAG: hypothetical protein IPF99_28655, partial [Deltaproteobacteria bacterium]|nr:hypothetical protein [Deltaproteobacteria bacterium]